MAKSTATPQQKYTGKNCSNNKVYVDFENRTVRFLPVGKTAVQTWWFLIMIEGLVHIAMIALYWIAAPLAIVQLIGGTKIPPEVSSMVGQTFMWGLFAAWVIWAMATTFTKFINAEWRHYDFPSWNAMRYKVIRQMVFHDNSGGIKRRRVNWKSIKDKKFVLRDCKNIALDYKVTGEFAQHLKSITIENAYLADDTEWVCIFEWDINPRKGGMTLEYM